MRANGRAAKAISPAASPWHHAATQRGHRATAPLRPAATAGASIQAGGLARTYQSPGLCGCHHQLASALAAVASFGGITGGSSNRPLSRGGEQRDEVMRSNTGCADWVVVGALVIALAAEVGCSAALASQVCFYGSRKFLGGCQAFCSLELRAVHQVGQLGAVGMGGGGSSQDIAAKTAPNRARPTQPPDSVVPRSLESSAGLRGSVLLPALAFFGRRSRTKPGPETGTEPSGPSLARIRLNRPPGKPKDGRLRPIDGRRLEHRTIAISTLG
jgi:hypothetical protein